MLIRNHPRTPTKTTLSGLPYGRMGINATLKAMADVVSKAKKNIVNRELALSIVENLPSKCWTCEAKAIHSYVLNNIRYVRDIDGIETVATPEKTLEYKQGDCDDMSVLAATLLQCIGHPVRFVAVGFNNRPLSHVLIETLIGDKWLPMELTESLPFGDYPPNITSRKIKNIKL